MRRASPLAALVACLLLATSCQRPAAEPPAATLAPAPPTATATPTPAPTPTPTDPYAVPTPIDPAYAERVINRLYEINGDAARLSFEAGVVTPEARLLLESIYEQPYVDLTVQSLLEEIALARPEVRRPPGNVTMTVAQVLGASEGCVTAAGLRDFSGTLVAPPNRVGREDLVRLSRAEVAAPNDTGWRISGLETRTDGTRGDLCVVS